MVKYTIYFALMLNFTIFKLHAQEMLVGVASEGGIYGVGAILKANADGSNLKADHSIFAVPGSSPRSTELVQAANGKLYGMASSGGAYQQGIIFELDPATNVYLRKVDFDGATIGGAPVGSMISGPNGILYGMTANGGKHGYGVIFEYNPTTNAITKKHDFDGATGGNPFGDLMIAPNGRLCGLTYRGGTQDFGVLFDLNPVTNEYTVRHNFNGTTGINPQGSLVLTKSGKIFGMASNGGSFGLGTLFEYNYASGTVTKRLDFSGAANGALPLGKLLEAKDSLLYGMTLLGGSFDKGVLFTFNPTNYTLTKKYEFGNIETGILPYGSLMQASNGQMFGTTEQGLNGFGGLFEFNPSSGAMVTAIVFDGSRHGNGGTSRCTPMQATNGKIYGATSSGGKDLSGVLFVYEPITGDYEVLVSFNYAPHGSVPLASLVQADNGKFYGTNYLGGEQAGGYLFEYDVSHSEFETKVELTQERGTNVTGAMVKAANGKLYGLARFGGNENSGVLFEFDPVTSVYTKRVNFVPHLGNPIGSLTILPDGTMYGATYNGGNFNLGVLFKFNPNNNTVEKMVDFDGTSKGGYPRGELILFNNRLYGLTERGGSSDDGVMFEFNIANNEYTVLRHFNRSGTGALPVRGLVRAKNNKIYGATSSGGSFFMGTIFEYDPSTKVFTKKMDLPYDENLGLSMVSGFMESSNGKLYGSFSQGGSFGLGSFIEYDIAANKLTKKQDFNGPNGARNQASPMVFASMQPQSLTFAPLPDKKYGDPPFTLTATTNSAFPITFSSSNPEIASISGNTVTIKGGGTVEITAFVPGTINLHSAKVKRTLVIKKLDQTITFAAIADKKATDDSFFLSASASSNLPVSFTSSNIDIVQIFADVATIVGAGEVEITARQEGNLIYEKVEAKRTLKVTKVDQTITFNAIPDKTLLDAPFKTNATITSELPISYAISDTSIATISGDLVTIKKTGSAIITAKQEGNYAYNAAPSIQRTLKVNKIDQTITFEALPAMTTSVKSYALSVSTSSGLPITITSSDTSIAKVVGTTMHILWAGSTRITASQPGNLIYSPAKDVSYLVVIKLVTSVGDLAKEELYHVYPNPANNEFTLELPTNKYASVPVLNAYDMVGRMIVLPIERMENGQYKCNVSSLKSGRYVMQVPDSDVKFTLMVIK